MLSLLVSDFKFSLVTTNVPNFGNFENSKCMQAKTVTVFSLLDWLPVYFAERFQGCQSIRDCHSNFCHNFSVQAHILEVQLNMVQTLLSGMSIVPVPFLAQFSSFWR